MKNEMYANLLAEIRRLNAKVNEMMNNDGDDDDDEGCDDTSADLERIGDELEEISNVLNEMYNDDTTLDNISKSIDINAAEIQNVAEKIENCFCDTSYDISAIGEYMEKIHDLYEEKLMREKNDFIVLNAQHPDGSIVPVKVRISAITLIVDIPNEEGVSEVLTPSFGSNNAVRVYHTSDEVLELIRKAKRTNYEVYKETLAENGVTEDEIFCYVAHQSPDLAAPHMTMEQTISYIDKVKKAKDEGFDFSIEHLEARRKAREEEIMKKAQADMNRSND